MKINILGQEYEVLAKKESEYPKLLSANASGLAELYSKQLILNKDSMVEDSETYNNLAEYTDKVLRHEIVHAYFHEAGLSTYCQDEVLVEWIAQQLPKMMGTVHDARVMFKNGVSEQAPFYSTDCMD